MKRSWVLRGDAAAGVAILLLALAVCAALAGCRGTSRDRSAESAPAQRPTASQPTSIDAPPQPAPLGLCGDEPRRERLAEGLELLTVPPTRPPAVETDDACLRVLRADPARFRVEVGSAARGGEARPATRWAEDLGAAAVINASMYHDDGASTGLLVDGDVLYGAINKKFGAFLAAQPRDPEASAPVALWGRSCPGSLEALRRDYRVIVQNYRLLDCDGSAIRWADDKVYSAAAVGVDRSGRILLIHTRAPYLMATFTAMLADPATGLDLAAAMYVEGGPEATLFIDAAGRRGLFVGSFETDFHESDSNTDAWPLPNVLALVERR